MSKYKSFTVYCNQCEALAINGMPCHEHGCPNRQYDWKYAFGHCYPENIELPEWRKERSRDDR